MRIAIYKIFCDDPHEILCGNAHIKINRSPWDNKYFTIQIGLDTGIRLCINFDETDIVEDLGSKCPN